jgi:hypothetical protein
MPGGRRAEGRPDRPRSGAAAQVAPVIDLTSAPLLPNVSSCPESRNARQGGQLQGQQPPPKPKVIRLRIARLGVSCLN